MNMRIVTLSGVAAIGLGVVLFILSSLSTMDYTVIRPASGFVLFFVGVLTVVMDRLATPESKTAGLLIGGLVMVIFGEQMPSIIYRIVFGSESNVDFRDAGMVFLLLGLASVLSAWVLVVLNSKTRK